jgi:hypothetical protein
MAARRNSGLDADQVDEIRARVAAGGRIRVIVPGSQFPAGTTGTVVRVADPAISDDYVIVRVIVSGVVDELGFAPGELTLVRPGRPPKAVVSAKTASAKVPPKAPPPPKAPVAQPPPVEIPAAKVPAPKAAAPRKRVALGTPVSMSIASTGSSCAVTVMRGSRAVTRNATVPPGVVGAIAELLDRAEITEAVATINDSAQAEAEARAQQLRRELADVEAILASHAAP